MREVLMCMNDGCDWSLCNHIEVCDQVCTMCPADGIKAKISHNDAVEWWEKQENYKVVQQ